MRAGQDDLFAGGGEMSALMRAFDWPSTRLGPPSSWPQQLRTMVGVLLANRFPMALWWGRDLTQLYNDGYLPILGEKHPAALGGSARETWHEIWHIIGTMAEGVLAGGPSVLAKHLLLPINRKGYVEETFFTFSYSPVPDGTGGTSGVLVTLQETTERVRADRQLRMLRDLAARGVDAQTAEEACSAAMSVLATNRADFPLTLLYLLDERGNPRLVAQSGTDGAPGPRAAEHPWPLAEALQTGREILVSDLMLGCVPVRDGEPGLVHRAMVIPLVRSGHAPIGVVVAGLSVRRELDERYRELLRLTGDHLLAAISRARVVEEERRRTKTLAEVDRAKTAFFSNVSHEFRTPLTLMLGPTEEALASPEKALKGDDLETVHRNELRLLKLVNTLLDFAKIEAGRTNATYEPTDLPALTADLASAFRSAIERGGLRFEVDCPPLGEAAYVDREMWEKIVLNLLSNAFKFTFEGTIRVELRLLAGRFELCVSDTGVGIREEDLPHLFERFRLASEIRSRTHEGSGIGLALIRDLVKLHGGDIQVASEVDHGTTFIVSIPAGTSHLPKDRIGRRPSTSSVESAARPYVFDALRWTPAQDDASVDGAETYKPGAARIVFADDNADMRAYVSRLLRQRWNVEAVGDGKAALEAVHRELPDLVIADVMMSGLAGGELVRELRADPLTATIPIILLSARAGEEAWATGRLAGADDYVVKPFSASDLLVRVEAQLASSRAREQARRTAARDRAQLYSMLMEGPGAICVLAGEELSIELANPAMLELWDLDDSVLGEPLLNVIPGVAEQKIDRLLQHVLHTGNPYHGAETRVGIVKPGTKRTKDMYFDFVFSPMRDSDGTVAGVFVFAFDVTGLVAARRAAEHARVEAEQANRLKDEFLATMSHELRTPLSAILGWAQLLRSSLRTQDTLERGLETIERNARVQAKLVEDILDTSRIITGKLRLSVVKADLNPVVQAAVDVVMPTAQGKRVTLASELDPGVGALVFDPDRMQQIVWNLLSNSLKFTPPGGRVTVRTRRVGDRTTIEVVDTGSGISPEFLPHVWERFRQADSSTTRSHGGLGLGLAIVRYLVEAHGGTVRAMSEGEDRGATFAVELPVAAVAVSRDAPVPEPLPQADTNVKQQTRGALRGLKILVVDDDVDGLDLIATVLRDYDADVRCATSAEAALQTLLEQRPDVLLSDIGMPGIDGYELMRRVRALPRERGGLTPAIAFTAYSRAEDRSKALLHGFQSHLAKPVGVRELIAAVSEIARP